MSETRHTPGPWAVVDELDIISSGQSPIDGTFVVGVDVATCGTSIVEFYEIAKANARLIAAAPELLEACRRVAALRHDESKHTSEEDQRQCAICECRIAVAAAEVR